jgi:hypothetical protein
LNPRTGCQAPRCSIEGSAHRLSVGAGSWVDEATGDAGWKAGGHSQGIGKTKLGIAVGSRLEVPNRHTDRQTHKRADAKTPHHLPTLQISGLFSPFDLASEMPILPG